MGRVALAERWQASGEMGFRYDRVREVERADWQKIREMGCFTVVFTS